MYSENYVGRIIETFDPRVGKEVLEKHIDPPDLSWRNDYVGKLLTKVLHEDKEAVNRILDMAMEHFLENGYEIADPQKIMELERLGIFEPEYRRTRQGTKKTRRKKRWSSEQIAEAHRNFVKDYVEGDLNKKQFMEKYGYSDRLVYWIFTRAKEEGLIARNYRKYIWQNK